MGTLFDPLCLFFVYDQTAGRVVTNSALIYLDNLAIEPCLLEICELSKEDSSKTFIADTRKKENGTQIKIGFLFILWLCRCC